MMWRIWMGKAIVATILFVFSGCDSVSPEDRVGSFSVNVTGDVHLSATGQAFFGHGLDEGTGQQGFGIFLVPTGGVAQGTQFVFVRMSDRPGTGTYQFVALDPETDEDEWPTQQFGGYAVMNVGEAGGTIFWSTGGTLQITQSDASRLSGTFQQTATGFVTDQDEAEVEEIEVSLSGEFTAVRSDLVGFDIRNP